MKISIIGTGYVGLVSGTCFAETGFNVMCADIDKNKINMLKNGNIPIYEPGLKELVERNSRDGRLSFSDDIKESIEFGDVIFSAVGTPPDKDHRADLQYVKQVAGDFGRYIEGYKIFVNKSTVPVGTGDICKAIINEEILRRGADADFDIVSNPEFLREGAAIKDTLNPDRIVVGAESERAEETMKKIYRPITRIGRLLLTTNIRTAEMIKYAANSFLATKISFINEMSNFCEKAGADIMSVAKGIGLDTRIGPRFLHSGIGYGGSCFPKDVQAIIQKGKEYGYDFKILEAAEDVNNRQKERIFEKLYENIPDLEGKTVAIWGLAFKPKTDDMRDAPSIRIIKKLQAEGALVKAYDPVAMETAKRNLADVNLTYTKNALEAAEGADALLILTEWDEFRTVDFGRLKSVMKGSYLFDGRNIYEPDEAAAAGFRYEGMGRGKNLKSETRSTKVEIKRLQDYKITRLQDYKITRLQD